MHDLLVIGTGPGGYHAALRAAHLGLDVAVVDAGPAGGVCLNVGCIPTKALLHAAGELAHARSAAQFGLHFAAPEMRLNELGEWRRGIVNNLRGGVESLFSKRGVSFYRGQACFTGPNTLQIDDEPVQARQFVIATGAEPAALPGFAVDDEYVLDSTGALELERGLAQRVLIIGAGAVGLEFATIMQRFGCQVTVVEYLDQLLPAGDQEAVTRYAKLLSEQGIELRTGMRAVNYSQTGDALDVVLESVAGGERETLTVDRILVSVGRAPRSQGLGLEAAGVTPDERGFIPVGADRRTAVDHIYAVGDVAGPPLLAHKAMKEGLVAAHNAANDTQACDYHIADVIYTEPEWASVGLSEQAARDTGHEVRVGRFPLTASGRAMTVQATGGLVKVVGDADSDRLLGVHIVGPGAGELIAEAVLAMEMATTVTDLRWTVHPHPTLSESIMEAAEKCYGESIHSP